MNVRYSLGDYTLKVLGCDKSLDVLDFYYRNRNDFDIYESDKPEAFYTEEFIKNMLNAENKALMSLHFVRFFLVSNDNPDYIIGTISLSHINRGSSPSANMGYKIDRLNRVQYERSRKGLKKYFSRLNKLERFYNSQKKRK